MSTTTTITRAGICSSTLAWAATSTSNTSASTKIYSAGIRNLFDQKEGRAIRLCPFVFAANQFRPAPSQPASSSGQFQTHLACCLKAEAFVERPPRSARMQRNRAVSFASAPLRHRLHQFPRHSLAPCSRLGVHVQNPGPSCVIFFWKTRPVCKHNAAATYNLSVRVLCKPAYVRAGRYSFIEIPSRKSLHVVEHSVVSIPHFLKHGSTMMQNVLEVF